MSFKTIIQPVLSLKDKILLSAGLNFAGTNSSNFNKSSLNNGFYVGVKRRWLNGFIPKPVIMAITLVIAGLFFSDKAFAVSKRITAVSYGTQTGTATYGGGTSVTYTINLTEASGSGAVGDAIAFAWTGATPAGATIAFADLTSTDAISGSSSPFNITPSGTSGTIKLTITTTGTTPAGSYPFTITITDNNGGGGPYVSSGLTLAVNRASLTVTAIGPTKTYGTALTSGTSSTNFTTSTTANSETVTSVTLTPDAAGLSATTAALTSYTVVPSAATGTGGFLTSNYNITYVNYAGTVGQASLTITASDPHRVYGTPLPAAGASSTGFTVTGLVNSETVTSVKLTPSNNATNAAAPYGSGYSVSPSLPVTGSLTTSNYAITFTPFSGIVAQAPLTIKANDAGKTYGDSQTLDGTTGFSITAGQIFNTTNGDALTSVTLLSAGTDPSAAAGTYPITPSAAVGTALSNYNITYANGSDVVGKKGLTITGVTASDKTYDGNNTATLSGGSLVGVVGTDDVSITAGTGTFASVDKGTWAITATGYGITGTAAGNYNLSAQPLVVNASINPAAITVTADAAQTKVYGSSDPTFTYQITSGALVNGDSFSGALARDPGQNVGNYAITQGTLALSTNYTLSYTSDNFSITPAGLSIAVAPHTKTFGETYNFLGTEFTPTGLKYSDLIATVDLSSAGAVNTAAVGGYDISATNPVAAAGNTFDPNNYTITYTGTSNSFTVTKAPLTIAVTPETKIYGDLFTFLNTEFTPTGLKNSDLIGTVDLSSSGAAKTAAAGSYNISASNPVAANGNTFDPANYTISYTGTTNSFTVGKAALSVTADDMSKVYGSANPVLTITYNGFVNNETNANLTTQPTISTTAVTSSPAGPYPITVGGAASSNYAITYTQGTLTVNPAVLTITADDQTKPYGSVNPTFTLHYSGFVLGETKSTLNTQPSLSTTATISSAAGTYPITATGAVDPNYSFNYVDGTLTVNPAVLTVAANNQFKTYGSANPALTVSYSGFVNGDTKSQLTSQATAATDAVAASPAGSYTITPSGASAQNYTFNYVDGTLTVNPAALTIIANSASKQYGSANPTFTAGFGGFVNGDTPASLTDQPTLSTTATAASPAGNYSITASGASDPNYTIAYLPGTLTINPVALFITADDLSKPFGSVNPTLTVSYSGLVNGDTQPTTPPNVTTTATTNSPAGTYPITASGAADVSYTIAYSPGTLTITSTPLSFAALPAQTYGADDFDPGATSTLPITYTSSNLSVATIVGGQIHIVGAGTSTITAAAGSSSVQQLLTVHQAPLTITADSKSITYGSAVPSLTLNISGFVNGETSASLTTQPSINTTATGVPSAGTYPITVSGAVDPNYSITYVPATLTVTPVLLTITADNQSKIYGAANPALTVQMTGFVNNDTQASLTTQPTVVTAPASSAVGTYPITVSGAVDPNYTFAYTAGTLTVNQAQLTITANNLSKVYGAANPTLTVTYAGFVNGDTRASLTTRPTLSTSATVSSPVGTYDITASGAVDANYNISYAVGTLTVTPAALTITANNQSKTYGDDVPSLTVGYSGFVNGDNSGNLTTQPNVNTTATASSPAGTYPITASGAVDANYNISYVAGTLTVSKAVLNVFANTQSKVYGSANPPLTVSYTGFVNGETSADLTNQATATTTAVTSSPAGSYPITASGAVDANYAINYIPGTLTVSQAALFISADNKTKSVGDANPPLTVSYSGFVNGETSANLTTQPVIATTATASSPIGSYPITASGAVDANYTIAYSPGTLTVTGTALSFGPITTKTYGTADFDPGATSSLPITYTSSNTSVATIVSGQIHVLVPGTSTITANDGFNTLSQTLTVTPAPLTITANNQTKTQGTANPVLTVSYSGFVNGETTAVVTTQPTVTTTATTSSPVGLYPITASGAVVPNYNISYVAGTLTVSGTPLSFNPIPSTVYGAADFDPGATSTSPITYSSSNSLVASIVSGKIHINGAGTATITATAGTTSAQQTLTVAPAPLAIKPNNVNKTYGTTLTSSAGLTGFTATGLVYGQTIGSVTLVYNNGAPATAAVGLYNNQITVSTPTGGSFTPSNYSISYSKADILVVQAALTITANNVSKVYGTTLTGGTGSTAFTSTGLVNGQTIGSVSIAYGTGSAANAAVGTYTGSVVPSAATGGTFTASNYAITYNSGNIIVTAPNTLTFNPIPSKVYGAADFSPGATSTGGAITYTSSNTSVATIVSGNIHIVGVGTSTITATNSTNSLQQTLTVTKAPLTITADNKTKTQGSNNPSLTVSYSGFVYGQTNSVLTTQPTVTTTATKNSPIGTYPITASGAVSSNYSFTYVAGTLTITSKTATIISVNNPEHVAYVPADEPLVRQAVSPNGDGINDVLQIDNIESYPDNKVMLMNRNGTTIYEMAGYDNVNKVFDGHSNITKQMQLPGTYFYMVEYKAQDGEVKRKTGYFVIKY